MFNIFSSVKNRCWNLTTKAVLYLLKIRTPAPTSSALIWVDSGHKAFTDLHAGIGMGLALRGCQPHFVICDKICCGGCIPYTDPPHDKITEDQCKNCTSSRQRLLAPLGFAQSTVSNYLNKDDLEIISDFSKQATILIKKKDIDALINLEIAGVPHIGQDVLSTIIRHYRTDNLNCVESDIIALYARMAGITTFSFQKALDYIKPTYLFIPHNQYAPAGPAVRIAKQHQMSYFTYASHHHGGLTFKTIYANDACESPFAISNERWKRVQTELDNDEILQKRINFFFSNRYTNFSNDLSFLKDKINTSITVDMKQRERERERERESRRKFTVFTHINWDNSFGFGESPFKTFAEWIDFTIDTIIHIEDVDWIIKIHPAEYFSDREKNYEYGVLAQIMKNFPNLPKHISVIPPNSLGNPIDFMRSIDGVISCCGTSGLEAAALGKIVINATTGYYSNHGFTYDPMSTDGKALENYAYILRNVAQLPFPTNQQIKDAQKFLLNFFYTRSCKELSYANNYGLQINYPWQFTKFLPGRNKEIDCVCQGFLNGTDIIFSEEFQ